MSDAGEKPPAERTTAFLTGAFFATGLRATGFLAAFLTGLAPLLGAAPPMPVKPASTPSASAPMHAAESRIFAGMRSELLC